MSDIDRSEVIEYAKEKRHELIEFWEDYKHENREVKYYDFIINSLETDEAYQLEYEKPSLDDFIQWAKTVYGVTLIPKPSDDPDTYEKLFYMRDKNDCETCIHNKDVLECDMYGCKYEPTTKNDLGVDAISRADARSLICKIDIKHHLSGMSRKAFKDLYNGMDELPPVTPQEPRKGHWIKIGDRGFGYSDIVICKCSECEYQTEFVGKFDGHNLVIDVERADKYCSNCGSDNREVVEE